MYLPPCKTCKHAVYAMLPQLGDDVGVLRTCKACDKIKCYFFDAVNNCPLRGDKHDDDQQAGRR